MWDTPSWYFEETQMNKEKKTLPLGVSQLAKEIKHLDNLGGKSNITSVMRGNWRKLGEHSDNDPLSCSWEAERVWGGFLKGGYEIIWGECCPVVGGIPLLETLVGSARGELWQVQISPLHWTLGLRGGGTPDNRRKGKAGECALGTGRKLRCYWWPVPCQSKCLWPSALDSSSSRLIPAPPGWLRPLNLGFEFRSASWERTKVRSHCVEPELNQTRLLFTTLWWAHQWGFNCIQVR